MEPVAITVEDPEAALVLGAAVLDSREDIVVPAAGQINDLIGALNLSAGEQIATLAYLLSLSLATAKEIVFKQ